MNSTQRSFIKQFNTNNRESFNEELFIRDENDIIEYIKKVILSCQRYRYFTLKVHQFKVIDDYDEMMQVLYNYEENLNKKKPKKRDNPYEFVDLKTTDMKLLIVTYYIEAKEKYEYVDVIIAIPRIVNKYYFRISGNIYSALYQIVDGSTYNSSTSATSTKDNITLKTIFTPIRMYRNDVSLLTTKNEQIKCVFYTIRVFNKSFNSVKPFLARNDFYKVLEYMGLKYITILDKDPEDDSLYTFEKHGLFVSVPKYIFDNDPYTQSFIYGIVSAINKECTYSNIFSKYIWLRMLGEDFNNSSVEKGISILDSLESVYDMITKETIHLPEEQKRNIYDILRWMLREFPNLMIKDNLNIITKRIRFPEYIASLYAMKLSTGIYRISDNKRNINIESIKRIIRIPPMYLISAITRCNLVNYRNLVNDLDSTLAIKYTIKGVSGFGEQSGKSVPKIYRYIDSSHIGIFDMDDSPKSDPGMSGTICPLVKLYDKSFSDYMEPNIWESEFQNIVKNYTALVGKKEVITLQKELLNMQDDQLESLVEDSIESVKELMKVIRFAEEEDSVADIDNENEEVTL